jgi:hypothetical protein
MKRAILWTPLVGAIMAACCAEAQEIRHPAVLAESAPNRCVVSPDRKALYFTRPDELAEAIELDSGKSLWKSAVESTPLAATKDAVFVLIKDKPGKVRLGTIAIETGKLSTQSDPYAFPEDSKNLFGEPGASGKRFYLALNRKAAEKGKDPFIGTLFYDPATSKAELKNEKVGTLVVIKPMPKVKLDKPANYPGPLQKYAGFVSDNRYIQVHYGNTTMAAYVLAIHWDSKTGRYLETKEIFVNRKGNAPGAVSSAGGGRYVALRPPGADGGSFYSAQSGKKLFDFTKNYQLTWWVAGDVAIGLERSPAAKGETSAKLHGYNLATGKEAWSYDCHDLTGR